MGSDTVCNSVVNFYCRIIDLYIFNKKTASKFCVSCCFLCTLSSLNRVSLRFFSVFKFGEAAFLLFYYSLLLFAEWVQMEITDAHFAICKTNPSLPSFLHFMKNNFHRLENCNSLIIHHNKHEFFILSCQTFSLILSYCAKMACFHIKSPQNPSKKREMCH